MVTDSGTDSDGMCEADFGDARSCRDDCSLVCEGGDACVAPRCEPVDAGMEEECGVRWPARPDRPDALDDQEVVFALRDLQLDQRASWAELGWDLDQRCTLSTADEASCIPPGASSPPLDGREGRDNVFGATILEELADADPGLGAAVQARMSAGEALLLHIGGWNGQADDPLVEVWLAQTVGVDRADGEPEPQWDGADVWDVSSANFVTMANRPRLGDDRAYIANRTLVVRLPDREELVFPLSGGAQLELRMTETRLTGTLSEDTRRLEDVVITGRFALIDLEAALGKAGICPGTELRARLERRLATSLDLRSDPETASPGVTCDAVSAAFPLVGVRAGLGARVEPPPPPEDRCPAG